MRGLRLDRQSLWIAAAGLIALVPLLAALRLAPTHTSRHLPTLAFLATPGTWTYYWHVLPNVIGVGTLAIGLAGGAAGIVSTRWRPNTAYLVIWIAVLIASLSLLPARDPRYVLLAAPAFVLAGAMGIVAMVQSRARLHPAWHAAMLTAGIGASLWSASGIRVPQVSGFRELAAYLRDTAPADAVLYDGDYDGVLGFYVRALDPMYERRMVVADKFLYQYGPSTTFAPVQRTNARTAEDVVGLVHDRCGCRWVAVEVSRKANLPLGSRLLRQALRGSDFELARSFPIGGAGERRVDLYRVLGAVVPVDTVDLAFPSYSEREFLHVSPITR